MDEQQEMKIKNPWHRPKIIFIAAFIAMGIIIMVAIAVIQNKPLLQKYKYGIVLDAGSSHTSVYIYEWPAEKENNTGMVQQKLSCDVKGKGISSYSGAPHKAGESLKECMDKAKKIIPKHRHHETPVYLGATAGMRLLRMDSNISSKEVLASVEKYLQSYPFSYQGARIITGQEEGAFGWITVNYLKDNLREASESMGALDLGGASTQITFVSKQNIALSPENFINFRLYGNDYHLYTHSFLCYGKDQVLKLSLEKQMQPKRDMTDNIILEDPCFHPDYNMTKSFQSVFDSPCVKKLNSSERTHNLIHIGTGDWDKCHEAVKKVFNTTNCNYSHCSFNDIFQPPVEGHFGAFSAYFFVMKFLNLTDCDLNEAKEKLATFCKTPWNILKQKHHDVKEKYLAEYCFSGTYIISLLEDGYKFNSQNWKTIDFIKKIGDSEAGWTLGYMLNLTNMIPAEAPDTPLLPYGGYVTLMLILSVLIFVLLILGYIFFRRPSRSAHKEII